MLRSILSSSVHPRVCGELGRRRRPNALVFRFIPACAGNSRSTSTRWTRNSVHPRVCGELAAKRGEKAIPRRFIPACAGNSRGGRSACESLPVHPRVCGELDDALAGDAVKVGSSPRVRGTPPRCYGEVRAIRFIPACAGNSTSRGRGRGTMAVHPRVCGELVPIIAQSVGVRGSSPRVRGTRPREAAGPRGFRFIPACAGNSLPSTTEHCHAPVHPRVCGELAIFRSTAGPSSGSSPRVRGTPTETATTA